MTDSLVWNVAVVAALLASGLGILYRRLQRTSEVDRARLESLLAAKTLQLESTQTSLERSHDITLETLSDALDLRIGDPENRCKRVAAFTIALARAVGIPSAEIKVIARGAFLRDIGKMAIPDEILFKSGPLTDDEVAAMEEHCHLGYKMLSRNPLLVESAPIVYSHHERYDGLGYPRGIRGNEIPIGARLVTLAEALDSMIFSHPVRQKEILQAAREEIEISAGGRFDPQVVRAFLEVPEQLWMDLRKEADTYNNGFRQ